MDNKNNGSLKAEITNNDVYRSMYHLKTTKKTEKAYVKKEEEYKDIFTSGITFLTVSILGIILLLLNLLDIIVIFYSLLPFLIMGALFLTFFVVGVLSLKKAFVVKAQIHEEERITSIITEWLHENLKKEELFRKLLGEHEINEKFYIITEHIRELIISQFGELDESYLNYLVEEYYDEVFNY